MGNETLNFATTISENVGFVSRRFAVTVSVRSSFLFKYMPESGGLFPLSLLRDVSTLQGTGAPLKPEILAGFTKQGTHRAMDDISGEMVAEPAYYRESISLL